MNNETGKAQREEEDQSHYQNKEDYKEMEVLIKSQDDYFNKTNEDKSEEQKEEKFEINKWMASLIKAFSKRTKERGNIKKIIDCRLIWAFYIFTIFVIFEHKQRYVSNRRRRDVKR